MNDLITVIIPFYNAENFIKPCLKHIVQQTYQNLEIIFVDDGSQDGSPELVKKAAEKDNRIIYLYQKNSGPGTARNLALKHAHGQYIMFCDADDWFAPNMCEKMLDAIKENKTDMAISRYIVVDEKNKTLSKLKSRVCGTYQSGEKKFYKVPHSLWDKIFKKSIIDQYQLEFPDTYEGEDVCFLKKYLLCCANVFYSPEYLYYHSQRTDSLCGQLNSKTSSHLNDVAVNAMNFYDFLIKYHLIEKYAGYFLDEYIKQFIYKWKRTKSSLQNELLKSNCQFIEKYNLIKKLHQLSVNTTALEAILLAKPEIINKFILYREGIKIKLGKITLIKKKFVNGSIFYYFTKIPIFKSRFKI